MKFLKWAGIIAIAGALFVGVRIYQNTLYEDCLNDDIAACDKFVSYFSWAHGIGGVYHNRGAAYKKRGDKEKAIADFRKSVQIGEPGSAVSRDFLKDLGENP